MTLYIFFRLKIKGQPLVELGLVHGLALLPGKARGIGQACVLGDNGFGDAQSRCYSLMGEFAHVFKTQHSPGLPGE